MLVKKLLLYIIIATAIFACKEKKAITLQELKPRVTNNEYKKVAILGVGASGSRLFFENLYNDLVKRSRITGIKFNYTYLGKDSTIVEKEMADLKSEFDAILVLVQRGEGTNMAVLANEAYGYEYTSVKMNQDYSVKLFESSNLTEPIWAAAFKFYFNFGNEKKYGKISATIEKNLKKHNNRNK